jgi:hypothetical protein
MLDCDIILDCRKEERNKKKYMLDSKGNDFLFEEIMSDHLKYIVRQ